MILNCYFSYEQGQWVAQCIEYDIAAQGETYEEAKASLHFTILAQKYLDLENGREPFVNTPIAPDNIKKFYNFLTEYQKFQLEI